MSYYHYMMKTAGSIQVGDVIPTRTGTGTVTEIKSRTAKTVTMVVEYDEAARKSNGNQARRINRHGLATLIETL